jgi:hypothetical protein
LPVLCGIMPVSLLERWTGLLIYVWVHICEQ